MWIAAVTLTSEEIHTATINAPKKIVSTEFIHSAKNSTIFLLSRTHCVSMEKFRDAPLCCSLSFFLFFVNSLSFSSALHLSETLRLFGSPRHSASSALRLFDSPKLRLSLSDSPKLRLSLSVSPSPATFSRCAILHHFHVHRRIMSPLTNVTRMFCFHLTHFVHHLSERFVDLSPIRFIDCGIQAVWHSLGRRHFKMLKTNDNFMLSA